MSARTLPIEDVRRLRPHRLSEILPPMTDMAFEALRHDIEVHGQRQALVLLDGKVLDGRHRQRALVALGRPARVVDFVGDAPRDFVLSANVQRRHLNSAQSAMVAARLVTTRQGEHVTDGEMSQAAAAALLGVSVRYVRDAQWLIEHDADLADQVFNGTISLSAAIRRARPPVQREREPRPVLIEPHPAVAEAAPLPPGVELLAAAIELMRTTDPAVWVHGLQAAQVRHLLPALDTFARGAYDIADESGMI